MQNMYVELQPTQVSKLYETLNKSMKQTQLHLPSNITNSDSYSCHIIRDALTFIGEHNMLRIVSST
jgi:hypothetical protein